MSLYSNYKSAVGINDELILGRVHSQAYLLDEVVGLELRQFMSGIHEKQSTFSAGDHSFFCGFGVLKSTGLCLNVCVFMRLFGECEVSFEPGQPGHSESRPSL